MQAFPKDSANNAIGGSGPLNKDIDHNLFHGKQVEAFSDFSKSGTDATGYASYGTSNRPSTARSQTYNAPGVADPIHGSFNPVARVDPVHGDESLGLGTSTFLEGAPASKIAMKRRESESDNVQGAGGLGRKKSLAQKIRGMNSVRQPARNVVRVPGPASPEPHPDDLRKIETGAAARKFSASIVRPSTAGRPFSSDSKDPPARNQETIATDSTDYDAAYDQKGENIAVAQRNRAMSNPRQPLQRSVTHDSAGVSGHGGEEPVKSSGGILSRMKSLRGGKRSRPSERPLG
jgi:hypothetical protein